MSLAKEGGEYKVTPHVGWWQEWWLMLRANKKQQQQLRQGCCCTQHTTASEWSAKRARQIKAGLSKHHSSFIDPSETECHHCRYRNESLSPPPQTHKSIANLKWYFHKSVTEMKKCQRDMAATWCETARTAAINQRSIQRESTQKGRILARSRQTK